MPADKVIIGRVESQHLIQLARRLDLAGGVHHAGELRNIVGQWGDLPRCSSTRRSDILGFEAQCDGAANWHHFHSVTVDGLDISWTD